MKKTIQYAFTVLLAALTLAGCAQKEFEQITTLPLSRCLQPRDLEVTVENGNQATFEWVVTKEANGYTLVLSEEADFNEEADLRYSLMASDVPFTVTLEPDKTYYWKVQALNVNIEPSKWSVAEDPFTTSAVRSSLNPKVTARTTSSIAIAWDDAEDKTDLTSVWAEILVPQEGDVKKVVPLTAEQIDARAVTVDGLEAGREYKLTLIFGLSGARGKVVACTRPALGADVVPVSTAAGIISAANAAGAPVKLQVPYAADPIEFKGAYPDPASEKISVNADLYIYGVSAEDGKRPVLRTLNLNLAAGTTVVHLEDLSLDGNMVNELIYNTSATLTSVEIVNCEVTGYGKTIYFSENGKSTAAASCASFLVDGCYMHDINADAKVGGDFFDFREGANGDFVIRNSTFYAAARSFLRVTNNAKMGTVLLKNNTFNYVTTTPSSSNNRGIVSVSRTAEPTSIQVVKNVFLNQTHENEAGKAAKDCWVRLCRSSDDSYRPDCAGNVYFNVGAGFFYSTARSLADKDTQITDGTAFEPVAKNEAKVLSADPCVNSAAGKLYLTAAGAKLVGDAGDPRWWNAEMPEVIRETVLKAQEDPYVWDFTEKTVYDTEEVLYTTIIGNARIYATEEAPANVVMSKGIDFTVPAVVNAGVPAYSAVEVLTKGYGAVKVTAESSDGLGSLQVLAGGDRYPVLADGSAHTVLLGDLAGENSIYVVANGAITLKKVEWTKDLTPDETYQQLAKPAVTVTPNKVDEGAAEEVVISWPAVANAADYVFTFNGSAEEILTEPSYTLAAADVAALAAGDYAITVQARPVPTSSKWLASDVAESKLTVNAAGAPVTLVWDISSEAWQNALQANAASAKGSNQANWTVTVDGMTYTSGSGNGKWDTTYIQPNGGGDKAKRVFTFDAPADGTLVVTAYSASAGTARGVAVVDVRDTEEVKNVDAQDDLEFEVKAGKVYIYPKAGVRFMKFTFTYIDVPKEDHVWDFSSSEWVTALTDAGNKAAAIANWVMTVDDLTWNSLEKSKWNSGDVLVNEQPVYYIQAGGTGSATKHFFKFSVTMPGTLTVTFSNTGNNSARGVYVKVGDADGVKSTVTSTAKVPADATFDIAAAGEVRVYGADGAICYYKIEFHSN